MGKVVQRDGYWGVKLRNGCFVTGGKHGVLLWEGPGALVPRFFSWKEAMKDPLLAEVVRQVKRELGEA